MRTIDANYMNALERRDKVAYYNLKGWLSEAVGPDFDWSKSASWDGSILRVEVFTLASDGRPVVTGDDFATHVVAYTPGTPPPFWPEATV